MAKIINKFGTLTGWNNTAINLFGRELEGIESFKYTDNEDVKVAYGAGKYPIGKERSNYAAEASLTLYFEEATAIQKQLPKGTRLQDIPDFDIPVSYDNDGSIYTDVIRNCSFKNAGHEGTSGEGKMTMEYELCCSHIDYNV